MTIQTQTFAKFYSDLQKFIYMNEMDAESVVENIIGYLITYFSHEFMVNYGIKFQSHVKEFLLGNSSDSAIWSQLESAYEKTPFDIGYIE